MADDPWHLVALAARNHRPDTREERLGQWLEAAGGLLRKNSVSPDSVGPVIWTGLGGRVALTRDERSGLPISADIDTQTNSWRVDWTFDHIGAVPADGSRPVDMRAAADNTVANTEDHYWTLAEAQAFDAYPLYFVGGTFEGYDVQFVRRVRHYPEPTSARPDNSASGHTETSTTADPIADDRFCKPEDTVDVYYMPRFGETGAGRWLTVENAPRTDCVLSGFDRSKPIAIERSDATAFVSPHREPRVHIELPDAVVALSGTGWSAAELAVVAEGLVAVNSAASSDKATDLSTESDLERLQRATRGIVERTGPSSCSSSAREGQLQHGEPLDGW